MWFYTGTKPADLIIDRNISFRGVWFYTGTKPADLIIDRTISFRGVWFYTGTKRFVFFTWDACVLEECNLTQVQNGIG